MEMDVVTTFTLDVARYQTRIDVVRKNCMTTDQIDEWMRETRHKVMCRDEAKVD
jgi:hypothetical protein